MRHHRTIALGGSVLAAVALTAGCSSSGAPAAAAHRTGRANTPTSTSRVAPSSASSTSTGPSTVGTVLARYDPSGEATVTANPAGGFAILDSSAQGARALFYDASGNRVGTISGDDFDAECGIGDAGTGEHRVAITEHVHKQQAEGIHVAKYSLQMQALDPSDGTQLWEKTLIKPQADQISCSGDSSDVDHRTTNGKWVLAVPQGAASQKHPEIKVVDASSGQNRVDMRAVGLLGNYVVDGDPTGHSGAYELTDPATGKAYGSLTSDQNGPGISFDDSWVLASSGLAAVNQSVVLNAAGNVLMADVSDSDGATTLVAYELPSAKTIWSTPVRQDVDDTLLGAAGGKVLVDESTTDASEEDQLVALDERTGKPAWHVPSGDVCGLTAKQLMLSVNNQLAVIDMQTGKQLSYSGADDEQGGACPDIRAGGVAVSDDADGITVTQALEP
jgi:outer membrane protein assembly factor BamB